MCNTIDYMRVSITDRCNLRCCYCMPKEGVCLHSHDEMLTFEEIIRLVKIFISLGGKKVRLTGGEPLIRKGVIGLIEQLNALEGIGEICLTTNGILLPVYAERLKSAGVQKINISLDTLKEGRFRSITRGDGFSEIMKGIEKIKALNFSSVKINMVVMKGVNDDEICDFVRFGLRNNLMPRLIEFMKVTPLWDKRFFFPVEDIKDACRKEFHLEKTLFKTFGPAEYYRINGGMVGFIQTSRQNCFECSRLRITSVGEAKACLYQPKGVLLRDLLRDGSSDQQIRDVMRGLISQKEKINYSLWEAPEFYMSSIGG